MIVFLDVLQYILCQLYFQFIIIFRDLEFKIPRFSSKIYFSDIYYKINTINYLQRQIKGVRSD